MKTRIIVGAVLAALLIALLAFGGYVLLAALTLFTLAAMYEMALLFRKKGIFPIMLPVYLFAATFCFVYYFWGKEALFLAYALFATAIMIWSVCSAKHTMTDAVATLFLLLYPGIPMLCLLLVYMSFPRETALNAACLAYAAPEFCDMLAYFGGTLFGKRKLCPSISPKKTVEGSVCALLGGAVFGAILIPLQTLWNGSTHPAVLVCVGLGCGVLSQFGDLFASRLKRWADIKDFSSVFPGHGGIMDRVDSMLLCAPMVLGVFTILARINIY